MKRSIALLGIVFAMVVGVAPAGAAVGSGDSCSRLPALLGPLC